ncbi:hypothetical protein M9458_053986, partial [Cirrhinus mrigala]
SIPPRCKLYYLSAPEREALEKYLADSLAAGTTVPSTSPTSLYRLSWAERDNREESEGDEWKTSFNTALGHFDYWVLPFGLVNAPAVFQALVNDVLRDMLNIFIFVYLDDILIFSFNMLENRLFVKAEKCVFHASSVTFLGSVVSADDISVDSAKVHAVTDWPIPDSRTALQRFLGFANFYCCYSISIRNFSQVAARLTALTSTKSRFMWSETAQEAFDHLKKLFTSAPILITPDTSKQFIVKVDVFNVGVGVVLSQLSHLDDRVHPCAFFSHRLSQAERSYDVGNRELLAIQLALEDGPSSETILPSGRVVGVVTWGIARLCSTPVPSMCLKLWIIYVSALDQALSVRV